MRTADRELVDMLTEQPPTRSPISTASLGARLSLDRSSTLSAPTGSISLVVGQSHQDPNTLKAEALRKRANSKTMRFRRAGSEMPHAELRDATGQRIDPFRTPATTNCPDNHAPIQWDR